MSSLANKIKKRRLKKRLEPLWKGPEEDGVTQSLLQNFLNCRERFRIKVIEGLVGPDEFRKPIEYGHMWHLCEEKNEGGEDWREALKGYVSELKSRYPLARSEIVKWGKICEIQFLVYLEYWRGSKKRKSVLQETSFCVPYELPSGRIVKMRGKWDSVDLVEGGLFNRENKTKGDIDSIDIEKQLDFDIQTMFYNVALHYACSLGLYDLPKKVPVRGVFYNVVKRPLSGGRGTIKQKKGETEEEYYERLAEVIEEYSEDYFRRWTSTITLPEVETFERTFLVPVLEQLCDWYEFITLDPSNPWRGYDENYGCLHWRHPYGVYNPTNEGWATTYDGYLRDGSKVGLERAKTLFPELD